MRIPSFLSLTTLASAVLISGILSTSGGFAQALPEPRAMHNMPAVLSVFGKASFPIASNGYFLSWARTFTPERADALYITSETTAEQTTIPLKVNGATAVRIEHGAVTTAGTVLVAGTLVRDPAGLLRIRNLLDGPHALATTVNFLAEVSPSGALINMIDLGDFTAERICSPGDGTTWLFGQVWSEDFKGRDGLKYDMLRHINSAGSLINSYLPKGAITPGLPVNYRAKMQDSLAAFVGCNTNSVAVYAGRPGAGFVLEEVDVLTDKEATQKIFNSSSLAITGFAMLDDGRIFGSFAKANAPTSMEARPGLYMLTGRRGAERWTYLPPPNAGTPVFGRLIGTSRNDLVHLRGTTAPKDDPTVYWTNP